MPRFGTERLGILVLLTLVATGVAAAQSRDQAEARCQSLVGDYGHIIDAPSHVIATNIVEADDGIPTYCNVEGYISPNIGFELRLPLIDSDWNGKFSKVGCGGYCGFISTSCDMFLNRGYACIAGDMGHKSTALDAKWAYNNLQAEVDFGFRATHLTAVAGKALTKHFYGRAPSRSFYFGGSTGGRQGFVLAQRFPYDFDGIIAGVAPIDETGDGMTVMWNVLAMLDDEGNSLFDKDDLELVNQAVINRCDMDDGVKDGLLVNPMLCDFDPRELVCSGAAKAACLTEKQATAVRRIYSGPINSKGEKLYAGGSLPGSELSWFQSYVPVDGGGRYYAMIEEMFRYMGFAFDPGPSWNLTDFDFDIDYKRMGTMEALYTATNPDLRTFKKAGGKLINWHGWYDQAVPPEKAIDYYNIVERTMGGRESTQSFFRLYMVPGQSHGGPYLGPQTVDYLSAMEAWVEEGIAPDILVGYHLKQRVGLQIGPIDKSNVVFSRPLFPYPLQPLYTGSGDPNDASSFKPIDPDISDASTNRYAVDN